MTFYLNSQICTLRRQRAWQVRRAGAREEDTTKLASEKLGFWPLFECDH